MLLCSAPECERRREVGRLDSVTVDARRRLGDAGLVRAQRNRAGLTSRAPRVDWLRILLACLLFLAAPGCRLFAAEDRAAYNRDARLEQNFGRVAAGTVIEARFIVGNPTAAPLGLALGAASCACEVEIGETAVVAGGHTEVRLRVETKALAGTVARVVELDTTDPMRPKLHLVLRGTIVAPVLAQPPVLYFGRVTSGTRPHQQIVLTPGGPDVRILRVSSASGRLRLKRLAAPPGDATAAPSCPPDRAMALDVFLPANLRPGGHEDQLVVETTDLLLPRYEIPVLAIIER